MQIRCQAHEEFGTQETVSDTFVVLARPTMILYNIDNIRELFGHKVCVRDCDRSRLKRLREMKLSLSHTLCFCFISSRC